MIKYLKTFCFYLSTYWILSLIYLRARNFTFANNFYKIKFFVLEIASDYIRALTTSRIPQTSRYRRKDRAIKFLSHFTHVCIVIQANLPRYRAN